MLIIVATALILMGQNSEFAPVQYVDVATVSGEYAFILHARKHAA
jgi:hypothetical protein